MNDKNENGTKAKNEIFIRLSAFQKKNNLSSKQLVNYLRCTTATLSNWRNDLSSPPAMLSRLLDMHDLMNTMCADLYLELMNDIRENTKEK